MVKSANHGGVRTVKVKTKDGVKELSISEALGKKGGDVRVSCGCLCTPEASASLLTTEKN